MDKLHMTKRSCFRQSVAQVFLLGDGVGVGHEVFQNGGDGLTGTAGVDDEQHNKADEQTQQDAEQGGQQRLHGRCCAAAGFVLLS